jgi:hypothetical protein
MGYPLQQERRRHVPHDLVPDRNITADTHTGVSLITQMLYIMVFCTRYLDLFYSHPFANWHATWNFTLKLFYIGSSIYIVMLMTRVYARTREREKAWKMGIMCFLGSLIATPIVFLMFKKFYGGWGLDPVGLLPAYCISVLQMLTFTDPVDLLHNP